MTYRGDRFRDHICAVRAHFFFASVFCARLFFCHIPVAVIMTYCGNDTRDYIFAVRAHLFFASVYRTRLFLCHFPVTVIVAYCREHFDLALIDLIADLTVERFKPVLRTSRFYIYDGFRAPYMFSVIVRE